MLSQQAIEIILGIREKHVTTEPRAMAKLLRVTFFPYKEETTSENVKRFIEVLKKSFDRLGVEQVPYENALVEISLFRALKRALLIILRNIQLIIHNLLLPNEPKPLIHLGAVVNILKKRRRIPPGTSVFAVGTNKGGNLPMDYTMSFRDTSVITIDDAPGSLIDSDDFSTHFDKAMELFAYHMTNLVILVDKTRWLLYNFNASHPVYPIDDGEGFDEHVLIGLIPKIVAPIRPLRFRDFSSVSGHFRLDDPNIQYAINEFISSGKLFASANIYPKGKVIDQLPFRNGFYRWIGKLHLDHRNGMSYGFMAWQLPTTIPNLIPWKEFAKTHSSRDILESRKDWFLINEQIYVAIEISTGKFVFKVPEVAVLTQRSGSDKTHIVPERDLLKLILRNGKMEIESPEGLILNEDYKPSFDTQVILAHAVGNAIIAAILQHEQKNLSFVRQLSEKGMAIAHWHGYINPDFLPKGWHVHGLQNPNVACSSPQSAIYALDGKLKKFSQALSNELDYQGDIHIEPHHGTNINYPSLIKLAEFMLSQPKVSELGNKYLSGYSKA
jgi:hypothetical protein